MSGFFDISDGLECSEYREEVELAPIITKKCQECDAQISYREDMAPVLLCADCRDGIKHKKPIEVKSDVRECYDCFAPIDKNAKNKRCDDCHEKYKQRQEVIKELPTKTKTKKKTAITIRPSKIICNKCGTEFDYVPRAKLCEGCRIKKGKIKNTTENICVDCGKGVGNLNRRRQRCDACAYVRKIKISSEKLKERRAKEKLNRPKKQDRQCNICGVMVEWNRKYCKKCADKKILEDAKRRYAEVQNARPKTFTCLDCKGEFKYVQKKKRCDECQAINRRYLTLSAARRRYKRLKELRRQKRA